MKNLTKNILVFIVLLLGVFFVASNFVTIDMNKKTKIPKDISFFIENNVNFVVFMNQNQLKVKPYNKRVNTQPGQIFKVLNVKEYDKVKIIDTETTECKRSNQSAPNLII